ncbi:MAG TPA: glutamate-cysteine ligase family protein [Candidatus Binatus sp.]|uniref:glutamate--cysteine ligase n=1 Tax=Candidatus Binatus sp. TaxID=2811406 RepID=UPI002B493C1B|nr:glutamate-cysteine ligase family protein [Candidatus Binatus sp.]HKN13299.1 glutamate-cysteine ligase family protein [Candidatus Binatus sp.]
MSELLEKKDDLIRYFREGGKPRAQWRTGTEYEKVVVRSADATAIPYSGDGGVESILRRMVADYGFEPEDEHGHILALKGERAEITLEPGGQIELSGEQCETIHCAYAEFATHVEQLIDVTSKIGANVLGLGMQPVSRIDQIELLPKARYHIMYPYMARMGKLGQRMMKQTAGVQANLDYSDEADAMRKLRVSMGIVPILYAIFANSPLSDGGLNGYHSFRGHIWTDTDNQRSGVPQFVFRDDCSFEDYAEYALDVPMYFLIRNHEYIDLTKPPGLTFRQYLANGYGRERATVDDWTNHLTTIFTEVRLKKYVEVRTADSQPPQFMLALPALLKGMLYDDDCLAAAWDLIKGWSYRERIEIADAAHKNGLDARAGRFKLQALGYELMQIAARGLERQRALNNLGQDESIYLLRLMDLVRGGHSQASLVISRWKGEWNYDVGRLVKGCAYGAESIL